jgi:WD40 repeat protein
MKIWNTENWQEFRVWSTKDIDINAAYIISVTFSPDGSLLVAGMIPEAIYIWDVASGDLLNLLTDYSVARSDTNGLAWSPDGKILASAHQDNKIRLWDTTSWEVLQTIPAHAGWVRPLSWSPDGTKLASSGYDHTLRVWDAATGLELANIVLSVKPVWSVAWSPDGEHLAAGNGIYDDNENEGSVFIIDLP